MSDQDNGLGDLSLLELFRLEVEGQTQTLSDGLLALEQGAEPASVLEATMRAAHSLKGAARMVDMETAVQVAHALEDVLVAAQQQRLELDSADIDCLLQGVDWLVQIAGVEEDDAPDWLAGHRVAIGQWLQQAKQIDVPNVAVDAAALMDNGAAVLANGANADTTLWDLFRTELETHHAALKQGVQALQANPADTTALDELLRVAQAIKGAARLAEAESVQQLAHTMETLFAALQERRLQQHASHLEALLKGGGLLAELARTESAAAAGWLHAHGPDLQQLMVAMSVPAAANGSDNGAAATTSAPRAPQIDFQPFSADAAMLELFRAEVESHGAVLNEGLLALEQGAADANQLEALMRAAHSVKGAARMLGIDAAVQLAHTMEDVFVAAQNDAIKLNPQQTDTLLHGSDMLSRIAQLSSEESGDWFKAQSAQILQLLDALQQVLRDETPNVPLPSSGAQAEPEAAPAAPTIPTSGTKSKYKQTAIRVSAQSLNRLMGLAGEVRVESRWLRPFSDGLVQVKHRQAELIAALDRIGEALDNGKVDEYVSSLLTEAQHKASQCRHSLSDRLNDLDEYDRRCHNLADRLNREVVASRMRPFSDGVQGFQRMVRDLARNLNKKVQLEVRGLKTQVDRDILAQMEAPLNHLVRNAVDHGIESPEERRDAGKNELATITIEALHSSGMLSIIVKDDGRGIELERLRAKVVEKGLTTETMAANLSAAELMEFLFLPGFSTRNEVTEISGRGVGLDVVHSTIQEMRGLVRASSAPGQGLQFHMQLPLTLSVVRALLVEIGGEPYAFPLARIERTLKLHREHVEVMEERQYFTLGNQHVGILSANQVLALAEPALQQEELSIVVLGERMNHYGLVVDRFLGERNLVVQTLDPRLGKVQDVSAAAILEDGSPCLIMDVDDLVRSIDILVAGGRLNRLAQKGVDLADHRGKRVLVVDDSITVREVERNMLATRGYEVDVAVDGMDGWNAVRTGHYDLVISDVDMPRMNGFEFVEHIKNDSALKSTPVMIVSYKDREEDRARGLEAGADYYLTKGSFHDETLLDAVIDLIGEAD